MKYKKNISIAKLGFNPIESLYTYKIFVNKIISNANMGMKI